jgi:signal transduction histidine kinase
MRSRLESAIEQSPAGVVVVGVDRKVKSINPAMRAMLRVNATAAAEPDLEQFLAKHKLLSSGGERFQLGRGPLTDALNTGNVTQKFEFQQARDEGSSAWFRGSVGPILSEGGTIMGATVIMLDITEEKNATAAMHDLVRQLMRVQEEERTSLAYELHDEIGQQLTALNLNLHALKNDPDNPPLLAVCASQVTELTTTVRNLSVELRPAMLDELGLLAALRWYLGRQRDKTGYLVSLDADATLGELPADLTTAVFRVVREAAGNAIKHAGCVTITVRVSKDGGGLCTTVGDRGRGFDVHTRGDEIPNQFNLGLLSMRERASQLNGSIQIDSEIGRGTKVTARFPLR